MEAVESPRSSSSWAFNALPTTKRKAKELSKWSGFVKEATAFSLPCKQRHARQKTTNVRSADTAGQKCDKTIGFSCVDAVYQLEGVVQQAPELADIPCRATSCCCRASS